MNDKKYWLGFNLIHGIGASRLRRLYAHFQQDLAAAWHASSAELQKVGLDDVTLENLLSRRQRLNLDGAMKRLTELGAWICTLEDPNFPRLLSEIPNAPPMLYVKGDIFPEDGRALAVVGTRSATTYGRKATEELVSALVQAHVTIISGLALGIDTVAHETALASGGRTLVVLANGIDTVYPSENEKLAATILKHGQGAIVTEYAPRTPPDSKHFPARNRILSGLALGVLIVEAPAKSGALKTADYAAEQGREVFAVPGNITSPTSRGTNKLIQEGAKLVTRAEDILEELNISHQLAQTRHVVEEIAPLDDTEAQLLQLLEHEPLHIDEIAVRTGLNVREVGAKLTLLSLSGLVYEAYPMTFVAATHHAE